MERYIGIDAHLQSCTLALMGPSGRRIREQVVETNGQALRDYLLSIAGEKHICLEEGELSEWLYELCLPLAKAVVVVQPEKKKGQKSDSIDAWALADLLRTRRRSATVVYKAPGAFSRLKEAVKTHRTMSRDVGRSKNRLRALFRARGIRGFDQELYDAESRQPWLKRLSSARRQRAELYAMQLDGQIAMLDQAEAMLRESAGECTIIKKLMTAPGIGLVRASQTVATVITPHRFRTKRQFWAYCGFAVVLRSSSDWERGRRGGLQAKRRELTRGLNRNRNPLLKEVFKGAAVTVIRSMPNSPLGQNYRRLVEEERVDPAMARLTLARQIAAIVLAMWKKQEVYDPTRYPSSKTK
jgi:transposase